MKKCKKKIDTHTRILACLMVEEVKGQVIRRFVLMLRFWLEDRHVSGSVPPTSALLRSGGRHKASHSHFTFRVQGSNPRGKNPWIRSPTTYPLGQRATSED